MPSGIWVDAFATMPISIAATFLMLEAVGVPVPIVGCSTFGAITPVVIAIAIMVLV